MGNATGGRTRALFGDQASWSISYTWAHTVTKLLRSFSGIICCETPRTIAAPFGNQPAEVKEVKKQWRSNRSFRQSTARWSPSGPRLHLPSLRQYSSKLRRHSV